MTEFSSEEKLHHYIGIELNMQTWNLLGEKDRTEQDDTRMLNFAKASLYHWKKSPKFEPVNGQRGEWMISHVYAILGRGKEALESAQKTMRLTKQHSFKDFDLAYAYEALARAHAALGNKEECQKFWHKAKEARDFIVGEEDKKIFAGDLEAGPWFGYNPK